MRAALASAALGAVLFAPAAGGFELMRSGGNPCNMDPNLRWSPPRVGVDTGDLGASEADLAGEAIEIWRDIMRGRFTFSTAGGRPCNGGDGVSTIAFTDVDCDGLPFSPDTLAITVTTFVGNRITDADVSFNPGRTFSPAVFRQVVMHELGHVLGLDHSDACGESGAGTLMNSRLVERFDAPQADDIDGAYFIYPTGGGDVGVPEGANGCSVVAPAAGGLEALLAGLVLLLAGRRGGLRSRFFGSALFR